ncbi:MAG: Bor family protein [Gemmatirosa sp.]
MRPTRIVALALAAIASTGCYHAVVETGRPAGGTIVSRPWTPTFIWGLVAAPEINVASECPRGIARVDTQMSFVNGLAALVTLGIYTPRTVTVTCASGSASLNGRVIEVAGTDVESRLAAMNAATTLAVESGESVFVQFR